MTTSPDTSQSATGTISGEQPRVLVADSFQAEGLEALEQLGCEVTFEPGCTKEELPTRLAELEPDILVVRSSRVDSVSLHATPRLSLVLRAGAGYDTIDIETASAQGISVANCPGMNAIAVAELAFGLVLSCDRRIADQTIDLRNGRWDKKGYADAAGLHGRTIGVLGLGRIGLAVIERARAFGMKVAAWSRSLTDETAEELGIQRCGDPLELARCSDVVSVHLAAGHGTEQFIDATFLDAMKDGAIFVNTSRGSLVDEVALATAIESKGLRVGLDVYADEPGSGEQQFNSTISPSPPTCGTHHIGASTQQAQEAIAAEAVRVVKHYLATGDVLHCVNRASKTAAALQLAIRHLNQPGVLSHVFDLIGESGINVEEMENVIFEGGKAACARIQLDRELGPAELEAVRSHPLVLSVHQTEVLST
ncbi:MAG: hydroxyacid dehydrogenase [Phycisphaerae bacterium]|nr:hydroxyacid dehydrogenase [Phycisphaerae bacterium]